MKLFYASASPYVRKCLVIARLLNLHDRIELLTVATSPIKPDASVAQRNPLRKIPTLLLDDGRALFDSLVICEYLNDLGGGRLYPSGPDRWEGLTEHALADGMLDATLLMRYESLLRPPAQQSAEWLAGQRAKVDDGLAVFEGRVGRWGDRFDLPAITLACLLGYLDFRFEGYGWRVGHPNLADWYEQVRQRPEMQATEPRA